ncbi:cytochrome P450 [Xylariaceae sp. FL0255]|nr:cytochrome P450 [Xylariaceae sp. FL0255]
MDWLVYLSAALLSVVFISFLRHLPLVRSNEDEEDIMSSLPTAGVRPTEWFSRSRAILRSITQSAKTTSDGYKLYCQSRNLPFRINIFGIGPVVVIPPKQFDILNKSEKEIRAFPAQMEVMQPRYMLGDRDEALFKNAIQFEVVRKHMNRDVSFFTPNTADELEHVFRHSLDLTSKTPVDLSVWDACLKIIGRTANRTFIGLPLCRDDTLLEHSTEYAKIVFQGATLISVLPSFLKPVVGPLIGRAAQGHATSCMRILKPHVEKRLLDRSQGNKVPNDALQWMIDQSAKSHSGETSTKVITQRLLILQLVSIYTTTYALTNIIVNIYGSEFRDEFVAGLRSECDRVSQQYDGLSSREAVEQLYRVDSTVRESLRISPFSVLAPFRFLPPDTGLDLGDIHLPPNSRLGVPFQAVHHDPNNYDDPLKFDAFRFSREFEGGMSRAGQKATVDIDPSFLTFGYGRHVCPGRWYTSQTLKQTLAYLIQHYDVELLEKPESTTSILNTILPPIKSKIRIKSRG